MPVFKLTEELLFPPAHLAEPDGLLAIGGDLSPQRLLLAYSSGLFPWFNEGDPPLWWCPDPRSVFEPGEMNISRTLLKTLRRKKFQVTMNRDFPGVIDACATVRKAQGEETWITARLTESFLILHKMGFAHSIECWFEQDLVGGLYGVSIGRCFFGESMFHTVADSSKVALAHLLRLAEINKLELVDCQLPNQHLSALGAKEISREVFLARLRDGDVVPSPDPAGGMLSFQDVSARW